MNTLHKLTQPKINKKTPINTLKILISPVVFLCLISTYLFAANNANTPIKINVSPKNNSLPKNINELRAMYLKDSKQWSMPNISEGVAYEEIGALPSNPPYPESNPFTESKAKLGEQLFYDPRLSLSNQIACASCHDEQLGFGDGRSVSYGHNRQLGRRNAPSVMMSAFGGEKFWDGRASDLETQALMPIADPKEMAYEPTKAARKINKIPSYKQAFYEVFGTKTITPQLIAKAIATFERSLMPRFNRFDRFINGDNKALSDEEIWGLHLFRTKARCMNCHYGAAFSDQQYHNLGLTYYGRKYEDLGRYEVTKNPSDVGKFKTPSLRQITKTAPYMHNGLFNNLRGVLNMYNVGMFNPKPNKDQENDPLFPTTDALIEKLHLSEDELNALEAFLKTL